LRARLIEELDFEQFDLIMGKRSGKCVLAFAFAEPATGGIDGPKYQQAGNADRCHRSGYDSAIAWVEPRAEYPVRYGGEDHHREYHRQGSHSPSFHGGGPAGDDDFVFQGSRASKSSTVLARGSCVNSRVRYACGSMPLAFAVSTSE